MHKLKIVKGTNFKDNRGIVDRRAIFRNKTAGILKNNSGLTLVELIIALAISVIVVAAAGFILLTQSGVIRFNRSVSTEQQRLNTAFNTVRYSLRMAGFDYGNSYYIQAGSVPPVQVVQASYPTNPYEVLVSYSAIVNASGPCLLTPNGAAGEFSYSGYCPNFYVGQNLNIINPTTPPVVLYITGLPGGNLIQTNPAGDNKSIGGDVSSVNQILFYWGNNPNAPYNDNYNFNAPFNVQGNLYECTVNSIVKEPPASGAYTAPQCSNTIILSDYINNFSVTPQGYNFISSPLLSYYITSTSPAGNIQVYYSNGTNIAPPPPYLNLSITGESNVALSDSPAYSVHTTYNTINAAGVSPSGTNILKTLNSSVFLRNVYYGS